MSGGGQIPNRLTRQQHAASLAQSPFSNLPYPVLKARNDMVLAALGLGGFFFASVIYGFSWMTGRTRTVAPSRMGKKVLIVGGGTGGATVAAMLTQHDPNLNVVVLDEKRVQSFTPLWPHAAAGHRSYDLATYGPNSLTAPTTWTVTREAKLVTASASQFLPDQNTVIDSKGVKHTYDYLVLAMGCEWSTDSVKGLTGAQLGKHRIVADPGDIRDNIVDVHYGKVIIARCGTTLHSRCCEGYFPGLVNTIQRFFKFYQKLGPNGVQLVVTTPDKTLADHMPPGSRGAIEEWWKERRIDVTRQHRLVSVDPVARKATFQTPEGMKDIPYTLLIVEPEVVAPAALRGNRSLASPNGYAAVDKETLQHKKYPNIFALGDCADLPTSRSLAATFAQAPVLVHNMMMHMTGRSLTAQYDGYTSYAVVMSTWRAMWPEHRYDGEGISRWMWSSTSWRGVQGLMSGLALNWMSHEILYWLFFLRGWWYPPSWGWGPTFRQGLEISSGGKHGSVEA